MNTEKLERGKRYIVTLDVDAIVNAAKYDAPRGGGVDGPIHRAAGAELRAECRALSQDVRPVKRAHYERPSDAGTARHHTVGPV